MCNFKLNSKIKENSASIWFQHLTLISYYSSKNKKDNYISLDERNTVKSDQLLFREQKLHRLNENMISLHITLGKSGWNHLVGLVWTLGWHTLHLNHLIFSFLLNCLMSCRKPIPVRYRPVYYNWKLAFINLNR